MKNKYRKISEAIRIHTYNIISKSAMTQPLSSILPTLFMILLTITMHTV